MPLRIETLSGADLLPVLPALHGLRGAVFRTWPYLYDANPEYEESYMRVYAESERAAVVVAFDGERLVGASTCLPMVDESARVVAPFVALGLDPDRFFYFGESVLLPQYRGQGVGVAFFAGREAHARRVSDADFACFCSARRAPDHPARPAGWVPLDGFWRRRGYAPVPGLSCVMSWREVGHAEEMPHELAFWARSLTGAALPATGAAAAGSSGAGSSGAGAGLLQAGLPGSGFEPETTGVESTGPGSMGVELPEPGLPAAGLQGAGSPPGLPGLGSPGSGPGAGSS